jgi:hypothetical protein
MEDNYKRQLSRSMSYGPQADSGRVGCRVTDMELAMPSRAHPSMEPNRGAEGPQQRYRCQWGVPSMVMTTPTRGDGVMCSDGDSNTRRRCDVLVQGRNLPGMGKYQSTGTKVSPGEAIVVMVVVS